MPMQPMAAGAPGLVAVAVPAAVLGAGAFEFALPLKVLVRSGAYATLIEITQADARCSEIARTDAAIGLAARPGVDSTGHRPGPSPQFAR
ncbi:MAG: hypothetical protein KGL18_19020 [Burkholderiales bacterium]|nr:hypothetical protein [Burkholderiales bacterium]MDE2161445.1 hypothetical protein [Burkholderiales bacterium]MDE2505062.1 hypothetical protein [Burkholderiales bacterium]